MNSDTAYSIEYVPPGIVRAGFFDMTDFCLIYDEGPRKIYFDVKGVRVEKTDADKLSTGIGTIAYVVRLPQSLQREKLQGEQLDHRNLIIERLRRYIFDDPGIINRIHHPISIEE